ncbi:hypothetical protein [Acinetobacter baumannii]|uniref:hypothetical protein n=1 Tax=Acinetobacter baumannii TaxID=470 RepID=UPI000DE60841|nr:hypothetical protein [Acinetobacter baumannii]MDO7511752.1 hypothetical protein [Acinetobacter baumannii]SSU53544.1 Uncharacterised protein [Acinetobacter baumannii]SSU67792.1 Uncharacterised protein [Acinetobacter baumannii]SSV46902.1 Uncharacterised protein [Acinetobacter baumannii]
MTDLNKGRELEAQIETFKKEAMELWFVPNLADTYKNKDLFIYSIIDGEVFFMREQARQLWSFWNKAKAQAVPDTHIVVPRNREVVVAIEKMVEQQVEASGITSDVFRLDGWRILDAIQEASESGAEG